VGGKSNRKNFTTTMDITKKKKAISKNTKDLEAVAEQWVRLCINSTQYQGSEVNKNKEKKHGKNQK